MSDLGDSPAGHVTGIAPESAADSAAAEGVDEIGELVTAVEGSAATLWDSLAAMCRTVDDIYTFSDRGKLLTADEIDRLGAAFATMYPILVGILAVAALIATAALSLGSLVAFVRNNPVFVVLLLYLPERLCHGAKERRLRG